jgi:hypothetical protein
MAAKWHFEGFDAMAGGARPTGDNRGELRGNVLMFGLA